MRETVIDNNLDINRVTLVNPYLHNSVVTLVNNRLKDQSLYIPGTIIAEKYTIEERLNAASGEADLFICSSTGGDSAKKYVAKIYGRGSSASNIVAETVSKIKCEYIGKIEDSGYINERYFEISPYYQNGSLNGKTFTFEELKNNIIPNLNEAIKALHEARIIHKDIKPSNIMLREDSSIAVIDFGISLLLEEGISMVVDKTAMTPAYAAPETFRDVFLTESDYYSLGITIYELFTGHQPYEGLTKTDIARLSSVQKIPMPENMPAPLMDLITGLTFIDISNREDKNNINRRWTYDEVKRWLNGELLSVPGSTYNTLDEFPYEFLGKNYNDIRDLTDALATNWDEGKKELFNGNLTSYFERINSNFAYICDEAEAEATAKSGQDDIIFLNTIYRLNPDCKKIYWKAYSWGNLQSFGRSIINEKSKDLVKTVEEMLELGVLKTYLQRFETENLAKQLKLLSNISKLYKVEGNLPAEKEKYIIELGYMLSGQIILNIDGKLIYTLEELKNYMLELYNNSYDSFNKFCSKLIGRNHQLTAQFEVWLIALGKDYQLRQWKRETGLILSKPKS